MMEHGQIIGALPPVPSCETQEQYTQWYANEVHPKMKEYAVHCQGCPVCLANLTQVKDEMAEKLRETSAEDLVKATLDIPDGALVARHGIP
jgi:hypothetical protein